MSQYTIRYFTRYFVKAVALVTLSIVALGVIASASTVEAAGTFTPGYTLIQDIEPEVAVTPSALERLSWGSVLAGAIVALVIQLALNLLAIAVGATTINPQYGEDSASPKSLAIGGAVWVGVSTLLAMFAGGWVAARFAGIPDNIDGLLHGLITWAVVTLITVFLLTTVLGRLISGTANLLNQGLHLAGRATDVAARGAFGVANTAAHVGVGAAQTAAHTAGNVARGAANTASNTANAAARNVGPTVNQAAHNVRDEAENAINSSPELQRAMQQADLSRENIENEARKLLQQVGVPTDQLQGEAQNAVNEVRDAARQAAGQVTQDPRQAAQTMIDALGRILERGQHVSDDVNVDRNAVVDAMVQRSNLTEEQARQQLSQWEGQYHQARQQVDQTRHQLTQQVQQAGQDVQRRVEQIGHDVQHKVEEVRHDVEQAARDAAEATTKTIASIAAAVFAAIVIGAIAAGVGGLLGTPEELPSIEVNTTDNASYYFEADSLFHS